jgi:hypothetical protein
MSTQSAAKQIDADFSAASGGFSRSPTAIGGAGPERASSSADVFELPRFPNFSRSLSAESAVSRIANRVNAGAISEADHKQLLAERQKLLDKELAGTIASKEKNRLAYVRWSLDRVDDARFGADLDKLESIVVRYERFQADIEQFRADLERHSKTRRSYP